MLAIALNSLMLEMDFYAYFLKFFKQVGTDVNSSDLR
jgi:hypothetical protein